MRLPFLHFIIRRFFKIKINNIGVYESGKGHWELISKDTDEWRLIFVKGNDYSGDDPEILINKEQLKDLMTFIKKLK